MIAEAGVNEVINLFRRFAVCDCVEDNPTPGGDLIRYRIELPMTLNEYALFRKVIFGERQSATQTAPN